MALSSQDARFFARCLLFAGGTVWLNEDCSPPALLLMEPACRSSCWTKVFFMPLRTHLTLSLLLIILSSVMSFSDLRADEGARLEELTRQASDAMRASTEFMRSKVAVRGGYVYDVTLDLKQRRGEGIASPTEIWVQPPGTPSVGWSFLDAYEATHHALFLEAATDSARALLHGQLESGCWTDRVDFDPNGKNTGRYREQRGKARGRNYSTLDDDKSQSALRFLMRLDKLLDFKDPQIHEGVEYGLTALLNAQFANGGFPQGWEKPVEPGTVMKASFPEYEWRTEGRFKNYWDFETLNDGLAGTVTQTLHLAHQIYQDERYLRSLLNFGDFLIRAQLPEPQPAWAQQYNHQLQPIWARKFEPPAISGRESEDAIDTLLFLTEVTGQRRFLEPVPAAIAWLKRSQLADGQIARFYELKTNTPLYFVKDTYELTFDDTRLPTHYSFKSRSRVEKLETRYKLLLEGGTPKVSSSSLKSLRKDAEEILAQLDSEGRWINDKNGKAVKDLSPNDAADLLIESRVFSRNLSRLAEFVQKAKSP